MDYSDILNSIDVHLLNIENLLDSQNEFFSFSLNNGFLDRLNILLSDLSTYKPYFIFIILSFFLTLFLSYCIRRNK